MSYRSLRRLFHERRDRPVVTLVTNGARTAGLSRCWLTERAVTSDVETFSWARSPISTS